MRWKSHVRFGGAGQGNNGPRRPRCALARPPTSGWPASSTSAGDRLCPLRQLAARHRRPRDAPPSCATGSLTGPGRGCSTPSPDCLNPILPAIRAANYGGYYWVLDQAEIATDVMFHDPASAAGGLA